MPCLICVLKARLDWQVQQVESETGSRIGLVKIEKTGKKPVNIENIKISQEPS